MEITSIMYSWLVDCRLCPTRLPLQPRPVCGVGSQPSSGQVPIYVRQLNQGAAVSWDACTALRRLALGQYLVDPA